MFNQLAILFNSSAKEIENNALTGYQMVKNKIYELENIKPISSNDIIKNADVRFNEFKTRMESEGNQVIKIGLKDANLKNKSIDKSSTESFILSSCDLVKISSE